MTLLPPPLKKPAYNPEVQIYLVSTDESVESVDFTVVNMIALP
jgi:hypothetical protein